MPSIAIIGAGCSGLAAAHVFRDAGHDVTVFEQSDVVGGRAATGKRDGFIFDYGAQYIKGDDPAAVSSQWISGRFCLPDLVDIAKPVWIFDGHGRIQEGDPLQNADPKWNYRGGLNALPQRMAQELDVRLETGIGRLRMNGDSWSVFDQAGRPVGDFARVLVALPAPQAVALIAASQLSDDLGEKICAVLQTAAYNPLISVALGYRTAPRSRPYYALVNTDKAHPISWLAWEHEKAPERVPAHAGLLIAQMAPQYSRDHWHTPDDELIRAIASLVSSLLDESLTTPIFTDIYRWLYALPARTADADALNAFALSHGLAFCGDAFVGGRVHLAMEHGVEVAKQWLDSPLLGR